MSKELKKRIFTSIFLLSLLLLMYLYTYILISSVIIIATIAWLEFYSLIAKVFTKSNLKEKIIRFFCKSLSLFFLLFVAFLILFIESSKPELKIFLIYSLFVAILSDIGGLVFGRIFQGKKLTKISPKKTVSGAVGSFIFSIMLIPIFMNLINTHTLISLFLITLIISLISQGGDLFISFIKRNASVKNTSDLLPGHGGVLDRIDGIIFAIPLGIFLFIII